MATWGVRYTQDWDISSEDILESFPEEWADAQARGQGEDSFVKETLSILGDDQLTDFASPDIDWDICKL